MAIQHENLDARVRELMVQEIRSGGHYESPRLTTAGLAAWPGLLETAATSHDDDWLTAEIVRQNHIVHSEQYQRNGKTHTRRVNLPQAAEQLAEGEFNRYYIRALCLRAAELGIPELEVYRGKDVAQPRPESQAIIGRRFPIAGILNALHANDFVSIEGAFGVKVPGGPNSGITCRQMPIFLTRVELRDSEDADYEGLHEAMESRGFSRQITVATTAYWLPNAEYLIVGDYSGEELIEQAENAAAEIGHQARVIVTRSDYLIACSGLDPV